MELPRRRSPQWVRQMASVQLHGIAGHIDRKRWSEDTSDREEWLFDACLSELAYRRRHTRPGEWCTCSLCMRTIDVDAVRQRLRRRDGHDSSRGR